MTEELFRNDSYSRSCKAQVAAAGPGGIILGRTIFLPIGGGRL
jgi:misacylated tRNA(Ala) deacylase